MAVKSERGNKVIKKNMELMRRIAGYRL